MRPHGEIRLALLSAAEALYRANPATPPTMRELAFKACVGLDAAEVTVKNLRRAGVLEKCGTRRVDYRSSPVAAYRPAEAAALDEVGAALADVIVAWQRPLAVRWEG